MIYQAILTENKPSREIDKYLIPMLAAMFHGPYADSKVNNSTLYADFNNVILTVFNVS